MSDKLTLRPYQRSGVNDVLRHWHSGSPSVLLTIPTGGGKTACGAEVVRRANLSGAKTIWVCHRKELVEQAAARLPGDVGCIHPAYPYEPYRKVQVATVQTLLARNIFPDANLLVLDESHHFVTCEWRKVVDHYDGIRTLGLTATPERADGRPLGDIFDEMVAPVKYSELIRDGYLVDCKVLQPPHSLSDGVAVCPVAAYHKYSPGKRGFVFARDVEHAYDLTKQFNSAGVKAVCVEGNTKKRERDVVCEQLAAGEIDLIVNVYTMTEGVDVPSAEVCILARGVGHVSTYLQMVGRVLRSSPGKAEALLIDLSGVSLTHNLPTIDREYSLEGKAITCDNAPGVKLCLECGLCYPTQPVCPGCGYHMQRGKKAVRIYDYALREVYRGSETAEPHRRAEFDRLRGLGMNPSRIGKEYRALFGAEPPSSWYTDEELREEYAKMVAFAHRSGYSPKYVLARFRKQYGRWPDRSW